MLRTNTPSLSEWRALYTAAVVFRDQAPWQWVREGQVFGVQNPQTGEIGYCSIMGAQGEHFALSVYRGREGLDGLQKMWDTAPYFYSNPVDFLVLQDSIMASFEDREQITEEDRVVMQSLKLRFRGRGAWPQFRSYLPGAIPWYLCAEEARFLILCLEQASQMAQRLLQTPDLVSESDTEEPKLVRIRGENGAWRDELLPPPPPTITRFIAPEVAPERIQPLLALPRSPSGIVELGWIRMPTPLEPEPDARPVFPLLLIAIAVMPRPTNELRPMKIVPQKARSKRRVAIQSDSDAPSGQTIASDVVLPATIADSVAEVLLTGIENVGGFPAVVSVSQEDVFQYLKPVAESLRIELRREDTLPALDAAAEQMLLLMNGLF